MTTAEHTARYCADFAAGLADAGVDTAFISPGSRNTPLTIALAREPRIDAIAMRDERSAGFIALGYGKATNRPAVVLCTSGSAATHYFPAVVEADQSAAPLIVITADRPARMRGTSAPQTMDQIDLYGDHVKAFNDLDVSGTAARSEGSYIVEQTVRGTAGPVHVNVAFDEPLLPAELPDIPHPQPSMPSAAPTPNLGNLMESLVGRNALIVAGGRQRSGFQEAVSSVASALGAPILADPQCWVTGPNSVSYGDRLASIPDSLEAGRPDVILRLGEIPTSKPLWTWLEDCGIEQYLVNDSRLRDPLDSATTTLDVDPTTLLSAVPPSVDRNGSFLERWRRMDAEAGKAIAKAVGEMVFPNEPALARHLVANVPSGSSLFLGSSMPIRDVDAYAQPRSDVTVIANRGVNGIDGSISSALGISLANGPTTAFIGDIAALHDATVMSEVARLGSSLRIVVVNNDGGGIFSLLPQSRSGIVSRDVFERHWGTPHGLDLSAVGESFGLDAVVVDDLDDFRAQISEPIRGPSLIEVRTNRDDGLDQRKAVRKAVLNAVGTAT